MALKKYVKVSIWLTPKNVMTLKRVVKACNKLEKESGVKASSGSSVVRGLIGALK